MFNFTITGKLPGHGRTGTFTTPHGPITTPVFMPVGTNASVKSLSPTDLESIGAQIILANNYHLYLRPGSETIKSLGGLHHFMHWTHPILTDSGGFQVQSLRPKISPEGVEFKSHIDGSSHFFSPEEAVKSQLAIGADIIMALDISTKNSASHSQAAQDLKLTNAWLVRCKQTWSEFRGEVALFGIIQGGIYPDLRRQSTEFVLSQDLPGIAVGGETIGSNPIQTSETIASIYDLLPKNKPIYTMGVGTKPSDLISVVQAGADMFDCVAPTRRARCGQLYNHSAPLEYIDIAKAIYKLDQNPIDSTCDCQTCAVFTRAYLHHLFKCRELLYYRLATIHNLRIMIKTLQDYVTAYATHQTL